VTLHWFFKIVPPASFFGVLARAAKVCYAHFAATRRNRVAFPASPQSSAGLDSFQ
jgi:hypothetical protein